MRRLLFVVLTLLAPGIAAACEDVLLGDSIAVGMGASASQDGFRVIAVGGVRLSWAEEQPRPPCVRNLVLVIGTNDLRTFRGGDEALDYVRRVEALIEAWRPQRAVWVSPSCFDPGRNPTLSRGSEILQPAVRRFRARPGRVLVNGYDEDRCPSLSRGDGVHPDADTAAAWWRRAYVRVNAGATGAASAPFPPPVLAPASAFARAAPAAPPVAREAARGRGHARDAALAGRRDTAAARSGGNARVVRAAVRPGERAEQRTSGRRAAERRTAERAPPGPGPRPTERAAPRQGERPRAAGAPGDPPSARAERR